MLLEYGRISDFSAKDKAEGDGMCVISTRQWWGKGGELLPGSIGTGPSCEPGPEGDARIPFYFQLHFCFR